MRAFPATLQSVPQTDAQDIAIRPAPELTVVVPTFKERDNIPQLINRLRRLLVGYCTWEVIFVDDDSPDGTADLVRKIGEGDDRVRCVRRIGRRGLAGACIEGMLASQAHYIAVMDADLQHDESLLTAMLDRLRTGDVDLVVATRYLNGAAASGLSAKRARVSQWSNAFARRLLGVNLTDPLSGFFMVRRTIFENMAPTLSPQGFKILLDIATNAHGRLRIAEFPYIFRARNRGKSKFDLKAALDFLALLVAKLTRGRISYRFFLFCLVGATGLFVHMSLLEFALRTGAAQFISAQLVGTIGAITWNYYLNNTITYYDRRLFGWRFLVGLFEFYLICAVGALSNVGVASFLYGTSPNWWLAGLLGALMGVVWNYVVSAAFVWRI
jgi:dolichol-phosphate mannosyltransferase